MAAGLHVGLQNYLYYNAGTYGSPSWVALTIVTDASLNLDRDKAEVKARFSVFKESVPTLIGAQIEFEMLADTSIAGYDALRNAFINGSIVDLAFADQALATSGCEYFRAEYYLYGFAIDQKLENINTVKIKGDLAYSSTHTPGFTNVA